MRTSNSEISFFLIGFANNMATLYHFFGSGVSLDSINIVGGSNSDVRTGDK